MFPGVFIGWWILEALFYILVVLVYLIYTYFAPIFVVGVIIFVLYSLGRKQTKKIGDKKTQDPLPKQPVFLAPASHSYSSSTEDRDEYGGSSLLVEDEEVRELMDNHDIDEDTAEKVQELIDEGLDEDDAIELADEI